MNQKEETSEYEKQFETEDQQTSFCDNSIQRNSTLTLSPIMALRLSHLQTIHLSVLFR